MNRVCVFCGSSSGTDPRYLEATRRLGGLLAASRLGLVYGGTNVGLMGELANTAFANRGEVTGVIPRALVERGLAHTGLTDLRIVETTHERKALMYELADAFIALPGGFGTVDELSEVLAWSQLGLHAKPCGLLSVAGYFRHLIDFFDHALAEGFLPVRDRAMIVVAEEAEALLDAIAPA